MRRLLSRLAGPKGRFMGFSMMSVANFLIAVLMYLRQAEIARLFGTTWQTDAYAVALVFPLLAQQVISHAFGSSFLPIYSDVRHNRGKEASDRLVSRILGWMFVTGVALIAALLYFSRDLVVATGPGLDPESLDLASTMLRVMLPVLLLSSATGILNGLVKYQMRLGLVSILNIMSPLVSLLFIILGSDRFGIMVLPLSGVAGAVTVFAVSLVAAIRFGLRLSPVMDPRDHDFGRLLRMAGPVVLGSLVGFLGPVADRILASFLRESSVTALDYAVRIKNIALSLLFMPIVTLSDVGLSEKAAQRDMVSFRGELSHLLNWTSFIMVPTAALLCALAVPIVSVLFMRGSFGVESTRLVGYALTFYAPWLAQFGFGGVVSRGFYALKDSRTPVLIGIWGVIVNILLNFILIGPMGIGGLALATTLASSAKTVLLIWFLRKKTGTLGSPSIVPEHLRILLAAFLMVGTVLVVGRLLPFRLDEELAGRAAGLAARVVPGVLVYVAALWVSGSKVLRRVVSRSRANL